MRQRWLRSTVLVVLLTLVVVISAFAVFVSNYYYSTIRAGLEAKAKTATDFFSSYIAESYAKYYDSAYRYTESFKDSDKLELQFLGADSRIMISSFSITSGTLPNTPDVAEAMETKQISTWVGRRASTGERIMAVSAPMLYAGNQLIGIMRYVTSMRLVDRQVLVSISTVLGMGGGVMLLMFIVNIMFIRSVITPVSEITKMSKRIAEGSYGIQIDNMYDDEIGEMVNSINEMSMKIARTDKIQSEFISSISHELRTPLTAITGWGETLVYSEQIDNEARRGMEIILKEARRLTKMVEEMLEFTRMQDGRFTLNIEMIDIAAELEDAIFTYRELLHQDELEIDYESNLEELQMIPGDSSRLKQVFLNIFDNAAKYGREGGRIEVSASHSGDFIAIRIRDYGAGVPEDELPNIKMKFYKGSNAKERGSGIGLAVCDEIIKFHGGSLELSNAEGGGFMVKILLPVSSSVTDEHTFS